MNNPIGDNTYWLGIKQRRSQKKLEFVQHFLMLDSPSLILRQKVSEELTIDLYSV
ncbi:hypothetical protein [uncultured Nostoc sp.]|uniref:hypothetical protein n=1 Tax=uncultured Nostoc sp. TaxID=340711 RepID=UPI0035C9FD4E